MSRYVPRPPWSSSRKLERRFKPAQQSSQSHANDLGLAQSGHGLQFGSPAVDGTAAPRRKRPRLIRVKGALPSSSQELLAHRVDSRPRVVNGTGGLSPGPNGPEELEFRRRTAASAIEIGNYPASIVEDENTRLNQQNCHSVMIRKPPKARTGPAKLHLPRALKRGERTTPVAIES